MIPFPIAEQTPEDPTIPINMYYNPNAYQGKGGLVGTPGFSPLSTVSGTATTAVSEMVSWDGYVHAFKKGANAGYFTSTGGSWTAMTGTTPSLCGAWLRHAVGDGGVVFVDPAAAGANKAFFIDRTGASPGAYTINSLAATAVDNASDVAYMDGYWLASIFGTNNFFHSDLNDPSTWGAANYEDADYKGSDITGLEVVRENLFVFKDDSYEIYYNSGNTDFPFERIDGGVYDIGCIATASLRQVAGTLYWLGHDKTIYRLNGFTPERVSTPYINQKLQDWTDSISAFSLNFEADGNHFYAISSDTDDETYALNTTTGLWSLLTGNGVSGVYTPTCVTHHQTGDAGGEYIAGSYTTNVSGGVGSRCFSIDPDSYDGDWANSVIISNNVIRQHQVQILQGNAERVFLSKLEVWLKKVGTTTSATNTLSISWSDDMGTTFNTPRTFNCFTTDRIRTLRLGSCYDRIFKIIIGGIYETILLGGYIV